MVSSCLAIKLAVAENERLRNLYNGCYGVGTAEERKEADTVCRAYRDDVYWPTVESEYKLLQEFAAGLVRNSCADLLPVEENPSPETREQWIAALTEDARKHHSEEEVAAQIASWRTPPRQFGDYSSDNLPYDWRVHLWGCAHVGIEHPEHLAWDHKGLTYHCDSKWTPPHKWARAIAERYPQWHIRFDYESWESGYRGFMEWDGAKWAEEYVDNICMACGRVGCVDPCPAILTPEEIAARNAKAGPIFESDDTDDIFRKAAK
jgi:hypothetical protein